MGIIDNCPELKIECLLIPSSSSIHLSQLFTGFGLLERGKFLKVSLIKPSKYVPSLMGPPILRCVVNKKIKIVYDTFDGATIDQDALSWCDYYFKRSYSFLEMKENPKIMPLGFNYAVFGSNDFSLQRIIYSLGFSYIKKKPKDVVNILVRHSPLSFFLKHSAGKLNASISDFEDIPRFDLPFRVIFFTRLWDPGRTNNQDLIQEREFMNTMRVNLIRTLKKNYGESFIGGLEATEFAGKYFSDIVVPDSLTNKKNYLRLLRKSSIGISTAGLLKSNGWKIAEYIAGAKAIVSEKLYYEVPGDFLPEKNYLQFTSVEECINQIERLRDPEFRFRLMEQNFVYYHRYLRPDMLIWNTLKVAFNS